MKTPEMLAFMGMAMAMSEPVYGTKERHHVGRNKAKKAKTKAQRKARRRK